MDNLIKTLELKKYFNVGGGRQLHAVDGINIEIPRGKTLGVVGESGCGKSTLGRVMMGLLPATSGQILFEDKDIVSCSKREFQKVRREVQMIFQDPYSSLDPRLSVYELIAEPLIMNHVCKNKKEELSRVRELMETVGLAERFINSYPHELDGGRRQRIGVARALALNPKFIVCDEPVSALDVSIQAQIINLLLDLQAERGLTYMFITHDLSVVKYVSHDICVMYLGQMVEKSSAVNLFRNPVHPYTQALLSAIPVPDVDYQKKRILLKGELSSPINPKPGCRFAVRCNYAKPECFQVQPELKEVEPGHFVACHLAKDAE